MSLKNSTVDHNCDEVATKLIVDLVRIPSLSRQEEQATNWLVDQMSRLGYTAQRDAAGNAVGVREHPDADGRITETVVLLGHIDTVPGEIPVRIEEEILHGRGSVDAKGSLATFVMAGARADLPAGRRLIVVGAVEEESTTSKGARYVAEQYQPDWCVIGEPSGAQAVTLGYKGRLQAEARFEQPTAHSAGPQTSIAEKAVDWWNSLKGWTERFHKEVAPRKVFEELQISLSEIHTSSSGLADAVTIRVGLRLPVGFPVDEFRQFALGNLANDPPPDADSEAAAMWKNELRFFGFEVAHQEPRTSPLVSRFNRAFRKHGLQPRHKLKTGTSDMNVVSPVWKCPIVAYGPGDSSLDHTPVEHLHLSEYLEAIRLLHVVLND